MGLTVVQELVSPELSPTGHGLYFNRDNGLLFVGSKCCNYPMWRDPHSTPKIAGCDVYKCMKDNGYRVESYYASSVDISRDPTLDDPTNPWELGGWARAWTGLEGIQVNITYM